MTTEIIESHLKSINRNMSSDEETPLLGGEPRVTRSASNASVLWWPRPSPPPVWWPWQPDPGPGKIKVEPKVFFANERTFLSWLHFVGSPWKTFQTPPDAWHVGSNRELRSERSLLLY